MYELDIVEEFGLKAHRKTPRVSCFKFKSTSTQENLQHAGVAGVSFRQNFTSTSLAKTSA